VALIAGVSAIIGAAVAPSIDAFLRTRVINDKLVELAIEILKSD
jgi:hypothetical protein